MLILDIDMDFFQNIVSSKKDIRIELDEIKVWDEGKLRNFLEVNCGLSKSNKIKGFIVDTHEEVFYVWRDLIKKGHIIAPFDVIHIDAHDDTGWPNLELLQTYMGYDKKYRILGENKILGKVNITEANFLIVAVACGWIRSIDFIVDYEWVLNESIYDGHKIWDKYKKGFNNKENILQLNHLQSINDSYDKALKYNEEVPYNYVFYKSDNIRENEFNISKKIDLVTISRSPDYTSRNTDKLVEIIREYVEV